MADVTVETIVDEDAAAAKVTVKFGAYNHTFTGSSKRHPQDGIDPDVGEALAIARAMHKATRDLKLFAEQEVHSATLWGHLKSATFELDGHFGNELTFFKEPNATSR